MDLNGMFWSQLDPLYHLRHALILRAENVAFGSNHGVFQGLDAVGLEAELNEGRDKARDASLRFLRYQATETFLSVLLGAEPHGPIVRFMDVHKNEKLNNLINALAERRIHEALPIPGVSTFSKWLTTKVIRGVPSSDEDLLPEEIVDFSTFQASFFAKRSAFNAFKHGCRIGYNQIPDLQVQLEGPSSEFQSVHRIENGISWLKWSEGKPSRGSTVEIGVMECDSIEDISAIFAMAMLLRTMKFRRLTPTSESKIVQLPANINVRNVMPKQMTIKINFP